MLFVCWVAGYRMINKVLLRFYEYAQDIIRKKRGDTRKLDTMLVILGGQQQGAGKLNELCWKLNSSLQLEELCTIPDHSSDFGACKFPDGFILTGGTALLFAPCMFCPQTLGSKWKL